MGTEHELGNFVLGKTPDEDTCREAAVALLAEVDGAPGLIHAQETDSVHPYGTHYGHDDGPPATAYNPQDWGRKFLPSNGGCVYIDLDHLEVCTPETTSARDHLAAWHASLLTVRDALVHANAALPDGQRIVVLANNTDGKGHAYGSHTNFLVSRYAWDELFARRMHPMLFVLVAYQVSSIIFTGQGKVGAENGHGPADYQIAQRADFFEQLVGVETTYRRPICNTRDEPLCGPRQTDELARLHCIFYDNTLCHGSTLLKMGVMQIVLSMVEAESLPTELILDDPLDALYSWSRDPDLRARARLVGGRSVTAAELQQAFVEAAKAFVDSGQCEAYVPGVRAILALWSDTIEKLRRRDFEALRGRLDWVLKRAIIERVMRQRPGLRWDSPEVKHLDHLYSSVDEDEGLFWALQRAGFIESEVSETAISRARHEPPHDTRAWTRAMLLQHEQAHRITKVDWDSVQFDGIAFGDSIRRGFSLDLAQPCGFTRTQTAHHFRESRTFDQLVKRLSLSGNETEHRY